MNTGSALAQFTITLSQAVTEPVQVEWYTADGTAKAGVDYAANKGIALFAPGETVKTVDILVYGRAVGTEDRSFFVEMLPPTNAILGASIGECIIHVDTSGSTPVTQIIIPTGPQGIQGKSSYQSYLDTTKDNPPKTEEEWVESLKGDPAEIAQEVAPLIDVGNTVLTAQGTETLWKPDATTVKAIARRVPYAGPAVIATVVLADGDNTISTGNLTGDAVNFQSSGFMPLVLHSGAHYEPDWTLNANGTITIKNVVAGDVLYAIEYRMVSSKNPLARRKEVQEIKAAFDRLQSPAKGDGDELLTVMQPYSGSFSRTQHGKNSDYVSLYDFGATGDGSLHPLSERYSTLEEAKAVYPFATSLSHSLDWAAMQAAANSKKITLYTKGHYVVNNTVTLYNSTRIQGEGNADNINRAQTFIQVVGNIPLFLNDQTTSPIPTPIQIHIDGLYIYYDNQGTPPNAPEQYGKVAFKFQSPVEGTTCLEMSSISNCTVHGAYTAVSDQSGTYLTRWTNIWARNCHNGFLKGSGTTMYLDTCYTMGCVSPYQFGSVYSVTMVNCAMDQSSITLAGGSYGGAGVHFINSHSVNIMGFDAEGNIVSTDGSGDAALFHFENTNGKISGLTGHKNQLRTLAPAATGNVSFIKASGTSHVVIDSSEDDESSSAIVYSGSGYPMTIYSKDATSRIDVFSGRWRQPTGGTPAISVVSNGNVGWFCKPISGLVTGGGYTQETSGEGLKTLAFYTNKGRLPVSAGAATTLFELPNIEGVYLISTWASGSGTNYASVHLATYDGAVVTLTPLKNNSTFTTFTASGLNVAIQTDVTSTFNWSYTKL